MGRKREVIEKDEAFTPRMIIRVEDEGRGRVTSCSDLLSEVTSRKEDGGYRR